MLAVKKVNGVEVPEYAQCYCVSQHRPMYLYPFPFEMPDGRTLWMCANSHHQVTTLYNMYLELDGAPSFEVLNCFNDFAQRTARMAFQMHLALEAPDGES